MKFIAQCKNCQSEINFTAKSLTRPEMIDELGEEILLDCRQCDSKSYVHVNDVYAIQTSTFRIVGNAIGIGLIIFITIFFWDNGYVTNYGLLIGGGIIVGTNVTSKNSNSRVFNGYKVTRY